MNPAAETARDNLVETVRPVGPRRAAIYIARVAVARWRLPWLLPWLLFVWFAHWIRSKRLRSKLSAGAADYYKAQSIGGAISRMSARNLGVLWGLLVLLVGGVAVPFVLVRLSEINPNGIVLNDAVVLVVWLGLAFGVGVLVFRLRSRTG